MTRLLDVLIAITGIVVFLPVFLLVPIFILIDDGAPVFFRQRRLGKERVPFTILKFRTMRDGNVTSTGRLLRKTGIDEVPQFLNVLLGSMAMVGPRPLTVEDVARLGWQDTQYDYRWETKPGLTGLAQIYAGRSARVSLHMERLCAQRRGILFDIKLIALSFAMNVVGKSRVRNWLRAR